VTTHPDISVVVCTRNRAALLAGTLESLAAQSLDAARYEVVVVDNWSSDATGEVAQRALANGGLHGRCVRERALGLNNARNRGIEDSHGAIVAFLDDDARAAPQWLEALLGAFTEDPASGVGGPIELQWETPPPRWRHGGYLQLLAAFDLGTVRHRVDRFPYLVGTNMAFGRDTFRQIGLFDPQFDRQGRNLLSMGDTEFCHRVVRAGGTLLYEPRARVRHLVPSDRVSLSFLLRRSYSNGRSLCRLKALRSDVDVPAATPAALVEIARRLVRQLLRRDPVGSARLASSLFLQVGYLRESWGAAPRLRRAQSS